MKYLALFDLNGNRITTYIEGIHTNIPTEAIEITEEEQALYATNEYIRDISSGKPVKKPAYVPTETELLVGIRLERDRLLAESDFTQLPDAPTNKETWAVYRQQLRDFPATCDIYNPVWPIKP